MRKACWILYRWCRHCDDLVDHTANPAQAVADILDQTLKGSTPIFNDFDQLCHKYQIPKTLALDMISGFDQDAKFERFFSLEDLEVYAYRVAGTVGLMMSHIMNVKDQRAMAPAKSLGIAMQLTNIARDVTEDHARGRVYLPLQWLRDAGVSEERIPLENEKVFPVVQKLLYRAEELYREGQRGYHFLPFRAAVAVSIASEIYAEIGRKILRQGPSALDMRMTIPFLPKLRLALKGIRKAYS